MPQQPTLEQALRESGRRLHPSLGNPNWLVLRQRRRIFQQGLAKLPKKKLSILDVGGRLQPYREVLGIRPELYLAIDLERSPLVNTVAAAEALPFGDGQFDFVICTQLLQYCPDPYRVVCEVRRVLRSGGFAFLSVPSIFVRDHDHECWRFLPQGLRYILRDFAAVEVVAEGNSLTGFFRTANVFLTSFARPRFLVPVLEWTLIPVLNLAGSLLERCGGTNDAFAANFSVWAQK